jgi:hypothetical protein
LGTGALSANTTGTQNVAVGRLALTANTTASNNTAVGYLALGSNTTGTLNTAFGVNALRTSSTGNYNTAMGRHALYANTTGNYNTAYGIDAGATNTTGEFNLTLGTDAGLGNSPSGSITTASNRICLGANTITNAYIKVDWTVTSDKRDKTDIEPLTMGLNFVNKLEPVTYKWDMRSDYKDGEPDGTHKKEKLQGGLLAQDVEELERAYGYKVEDGTSILTDKNADGNYGLTYSKFIPVLINAIQELKTELDAAKARITTLEG